MPYSFSLNNGLQNAAITSSQEAESTAISVESIYSAITQIEASATSSSLVLTLDSSKSPLPAPGETVAPQPWQAIYPIYQHLCTGGNEVDIRSFARFSMRSDAQGYLSIYNLQSLSSDVRGKALDLVSQGLPSPSPIEPDTAATP